MSDTKKINGDSNDSSLHTGVVTIGSIIGQDYRLLQLIGQGGMGVVYKAEHRLIPGKIYAIKLLHAHAVTESNLKRFHREALALGKLSHQGIVRIYNFGVDSESNLYYVMEYLEGESLADYLKRQGPLTEPDCIRLLISVAKALGHAHRHGIIHRDLKPSNLMLCPVTDDPFGDVKIVDFGLVRLAIDNSEEKQALTATGEIFGTPYYMSPEQSVGVDVTAASDVYSLGCTMFEALTGAPPFKGENAFKTLYMHQYQEPPWLKQVAASKDFSDGLEALIYKMLRKNPLERYQNMERLVQDLERLAQGLPIGFDATTGFETAPKAFAVTERQGTGPGWRVMSLLACVVLFLIVVAGYSAHWFLRLPLTSTSKPIANNTELSKLPAEDKDPSLLVYQSELNVKPGASLVELAKLSRRKFKKIVFDGEVSEGGWADIFAAVKPFKSTSEIYVCSMRLDEHETTALSNLPQAESLTLSNSRIALNSLAQSQLWRNCKNLYLEKIDPYQACPNEQLVVSTDNLLKAIGANNKLDTFAITRMRFGAAGLKSFLTGSKAQALIFSRCRITPQMLKDICQCRSVKTVYVYETFFDFEQVNNAVTGAPTLKRLVLTRPVIKAEAVQAVRERFGEFNDPSIHWTKAQISAIKKRGVDLEFKSSNYVFLPVFDDWRSQRDLITLPSKSEFANELELAH